MKDFTLSVVIPTYNRSSAAIDTIELLLKQSDAADEIIIVDQTSYIGTEADFLQLQSLNNQSEIRWLQLDTPSIPNAMNVGLLKANSDYVLFLDDDVVFLDDFIEQHKSAFHRHRSIGHVGQIIQPWQQPFDLQNYYSGSGLNRDLHFPFHCNQSHKIMNCMAGNLCVHRKLAISSGGFDQRFDRTAYRFESEFAKRLCRTSNALLEFAPQATLDHLHIDLGGTRQHGNFFTSIKPIHSANNYYFALTEGSFFEAYEYVIRRFFKSIVDKFYLRQPWWIPVRLIAEVRGFFQAKSMLRKGPIYIHDAHSSEEQAKSND